MEKKGDAKKTSWKYLALLIAGGVCACMGFPATGVLIITCTFIWGSADTIDQIKEEFREESDYLRGVIAEQEKRIAEQEERYKDLGKEVKELGQEKSKKELEKELKKELKKKLKKEESKEKSQEELGGKRGLEYYTTGEWEGEREGDEKLRKEVERLNAQIKAMQLQLDELNGKTGHDRDQQELEQKPELGL